MNNLYGSRNNDTFLELRHCYSMSVNMKSSNNALSGLGYGVSIVGSNSLLNITGEALGCRHSVAFGGTSTEGGVAWDVHINNFTGSAKYDSQIFDTHYSCGRVHWNNCIGKGRIINTEAIVNTKFSESVTYNIGDKVNYKGWVYKSKTSSNSGNTPPDTTNWEGINKNGVPLFQFRGGENHINNCKGYDVAVLLDITDKAKTSVYVDGLTGENIYTYGLNIRQAATSYIVDKLHIRNMSISNSGYVNNCKLLNIANNNGVINKWLFENITGYGALVGEINLNSTKPSNLELNHVKSFVERDLIQNGFIVSLYNDIDYIKLNGFSIYNSISPFRIIGNNNIVDKIYINNSYLKDSLSQDIYLGDVTINYLSILNSIIEGLITSSVRIIGSTVEKAVLGNLDLSDTLVNFLQEKVNKLMYSNINISQKLYNTSARPDLVILEGSFEKPKRVEGVGIPEGVVTGVLGCIYTNLSGGAGTTMYVRETGSEVANTGWVSK